MTILDTKDEYVVRGKEYNLIYRKYNCETGLIKELARYELVGDSKLFLVMATYAKTLSPSKYYIVAPNIKAAKYKFKSNYAWLNVISSVEQVVDTNVLEDILNNPRKYILC